MAKKSSLHRAFRAVAVGLAIGSAAHLTGLTDVVFHTYPPQAPDTVTELQNMDLIRVADTEHPSCAVSARYILENGEVPSSRLRWNPYELSVDWDEDDSFIDSHEIVKNKCIESLKNSQEAQDLLSKTEWDRADRYAWEELISTTVSHELDQIAGLDKYRTTSDDIDEKDELKIHAKSRPTSLNDLATDIDNGTYDLEYDCEHNAVQEACLLYQMETHFLEGTNGLKSVHNYYYVTGYANWSDFDEEQVGHAFILCGATGSIVESTSRYGSPYCPPAYDNVTALNFINGDNILTQNGIIYGVENLDSETCKAIRATYHKQLFETSTQSFEDKIAVFLNDLSAPDIIDHPTIKEFEDAASHWWEAFYAGHDNIDQLQELLDITNKFYNRAVIVDPPGSIWEPISYSEVAAWMVRKIEDRQVELIANDNKPPFLEEASAAPWKLAP